MSFVAAFFNPALDGGAAVTLSASLHTASPGSTGTNEVTGGAYTRQSVTWAPASNGAVQSAQPVTWNVPAATTVTHVGFRTSSGVWLGFITVPDGGEDFTAAGTLTANPLTINMTN